MSRLDFSPSISGHSGRQVMAACLTVGAPLVAVPVVLAALHFLLEARFNRSLVRDMSRYPMLRVPEVA